MAQLKDDLNSYLSKDTSSSSLTSVSISESGGKLLGWAKSKTGLGSSDGGGGTTAKKGWFGWGQEEQQPDPWCPSLSKTQRILGFVTCIGLGIMCFSFAVMYIPLLLFKARKFALLYSFGSLFTLASFSFLWGPYNHMKHLVSSDRLPFTVAYVGSLVGTLYCALHLQSTIFTSICAVIQVLALVWYLVSYIPGGQAGLRFFSSLCFSTCSKTVGKTLPV